MQRCMQAALTPIPLKNPATVCSLILAPPPPLPHPPQASVNALCWAPHSSVHLCTAGDDCQALIWDLSALGQRQQQQQQQPGSAGGGGGGGGGAEAAGGGSSLDPILAYNAGAEINQLQWSSAQPDWVAICYADKTQILRV